MPPKRSKRAHIHTASVTLSDKRSLPNTRVRNASGSTRYSREGVLGRGVRRRGEVRGREVTGWSSGGWGSNASGARATIGPLFRPVAK